MDENNGNSANKKTIYFNASKKESHHPNNGFKKWFRRLKAVSKCQSSKEEITLDRLTEADLVIFGCPRDMFTPTEFRDMKQWLNSGGRGMILLGDGGEKQLGCNINQFLEELGITVNNDSVSRTVFYKYLHPKEVFVADGVLVPDLARKKATVQLGGGSGAAKKPTNSTTASAGAGSKASSSKEIPRFQFVYPYGASLSVSRPSTALLSSGAVSFPLHRPLAAVWEAETLTTSTKQRRGRLVVLGSADIFGDDYLDKEDNGKLADLLTSWLLDELELDLNRDRRHDSDLTDHSTAVPNLEGLAAVLKPCLQSLDELPRDFGRLFSLDLFSFDFSLLPDAVNLYASLSVPHEPLTLIPPQFVCPLPRLCVSVFPPILKEPPPPALDQFDLDEHFAKEALRLAQLTNKCSAGADDLEYFVAESGDILGVTQNLGFGERSAKHILFSIFKQIVDCKKQEFDAVSAANANIGGVGGTTSGVHPGGAQGVLAISEDDPHGSSPMKSPRDVYATLDGRALHAQMQTQTSQTLGHGHHVDLAPMKIDPSRNKHLLELDPKLQLGSSVRLGALHK